MVAYGAGDHPAPTSRPAFGYCRCRCDIRLKFRPLYLYRVTSDPTSIQEIWFFALEFNGKIVDTSVTSPQGWTFGDHDDRPIISWAATEGPVPSDFIDDGNVPPSPFQIKPGQTLGGFSFRSPDPPATARFFAEGFTKLPQVTEDVGELPQEGEEVLDFTENSFTGFTSAPTAITGQPFLGGRRLVSMAFWSS